jgi:hypothetical protein
MQITDTKELLRQIALVDNRKVTQDTIEAWHGIIGQIPFEIALHALRLAQQDSTIRYLEPRNIISWSREAAFKLDRDKPKTEEVITGSRMQVCKEHNEPIMKCDPCCHRLHKFQEANGDLGLERFAKAEIYAQGSPNTSRQENIYS